MFQAVTFLPFFYHPFSFLIGRKIFGPNIQSVRICALGSPRPLSPSVPAEAGHQVERLPGHPCVWFKGEASLFPSWGKHKLCYSNLWLVTLHSCFQPASFTPLPTSLHYSSKHKRAVSLLSDHTADCGSMSLTGQDCLSPGHTLMLAI